MNKQTHLFLFIIFSVAVFYICRKAWFLEPFGNQIIIHPDGSFDPQETTFSVLTYDNDLSSGYTQVSTCSDDDSWTKGDKTCRDYSVVGSDCSDIGSDGTSALEACKVACDNCSTYTEITRRIPSPVEDTEEPSYSRFQDYGEGSDGSGVAGREMIDKLSEMNEQLSSFQLAYSAQAGSITELTERLSEMTTVTGSGAPISDSHWSGIPITTGDEFKHVSVGKGMVWGIVGDRTFGSTLMRGVRPGPLLGDDNQGDIYRCLNDGNSACVGGDQWILEEGNFAQVDAGETEVWSVNDAGDIFMKDVMGTGSWTEGPPLIGDLKFKHVSVGNDVIWAVDTNDHVHKCNSNPCTSGSTWTQVGGTVKQLDAGETEVWSVNGGGQIHKGSANQDSSPGWELISGPTASPVKYISVGKDWVWTVTEDLEIYKCSHPCNGQWEKVVNGSSAGELTQIDATWWDSGNAYSEEVWGVNTESSGPISAYKRSVAPGPPATGDTVTCDNGGTDGTNAFDCSREVNSINAETVCPEEGCDPDICCTVVPGGTPVVPVVPVVPGGTTVTCANGNIDGTGAFDCSTVTNSINAETVCDQGVCDAATCCTVAPRCHSIDGLSNHFSCNSSADPYDHDCPGPDGCTDAICCRAPSCSNTDGVDTVFNCKDETNFITATPGSTACDQGGCNVPKCCTVEPTCANTDGLGNAFDCKDETNFINATPWDITCLKGRCEPDKCCTVAPTCGNTDGLNKDFDCSKERNSNNAVTECDQGGCDAPTCCTSTPPIPWWLVVIIVIVILIFTINVGYMFDMIFDMDNPKIQGLMVLLVSVSYIIIIYSLIAFMIK